MPLPIIFAMGGRYDSSFIYIRWFYSQTLEILHFSYPLDTVEFEHQSRLNVSTSMNMLRACIITCWHFVG